HLPHCRCLWHVYYYDVCSLVMSLFCSCFGDLRDLHSFPTRRSSDLVDGTSKVNSQGPCTARLCSAASSSGDSAVRLATTKTLARSEEHTSELQSRENLVCRLLLEKKKKKSVPSWKTHNYRTARNYGG